MYLSRITFLKQLLVIILVYLICNYLGFQLFYEGPTTGFSNIFKLLPPKFSGGDKKIAQDIFFSTSIICSALKNPIFLFSSILFTLPLAIKYKSISWEKLKYSNWVKSLCIVVGSILCWELATYDFNYYLNSAFYIDRFLILVFLVGIYFHPFFIPCFTITALLYRSQFNFPIGGFPLFDKRVLFDLLLLSYSFILVSTKIKVKTLHLFFIVFCLIGGNYFSTFQAKFMNSPNGIEWLTENRLDWFFLNSISKGWGYFLSQELISSISNFLKTFSVPIQTIIFFMEGITLFTLFNKIRTTLMFGMLILMHLTILFFGSMFFWKWIVVDMFLIIFILKAPKPLVEGIFNKHNRILSIFLIFTGVVIFNNFKIGWHDTPVNQHYTYRVLCENGKSYHFPKNNFNPYHQLFQYDRFHYINNQSLYKISGFGYTHNYILANFIRSSSWDMIKRAEGPKTKIYYNNKKTKEFKHFLKRFFTSYNNRLDINFIPSSLSAPHHIYEQVRTDSYQKQSKIVAVEVLFNQFYLEDSTIQPKTKKVLLKLKI